jgi:hypothetical protein
MLRLGMARRKNPAAVQLGKLGGKARAKKLSAEELSDIGRKAGLAGGRARAEALTNERRAEIARKAAAKRWEGHEAKRPASQRGKRKARR